MNQPVPVAASVSQEIAAQLNQAKDEEERNLIMSLKVLIPALDHYAEQGQFNVWKSKVSLFQIE